MKSLLTVAILVVLAPMAWDVTAGGQMPPDEEIKAKVRAWDEAYQARDVQAISQILADDFTLTDASGAVLTKAAYLMSVVKRPEFHVPGGPVASSDVTVRVDSNKATVTGRSAVKGRARGKGQTAAGDYLFTEEWVSQQGIWKVRNTRVTPATK